LVHLFDVSKNFSAWLKKGLPYGERSGGGVSWAVAELRAPFPRRLGTVRPSARFTSGHVFGIITPVFFLRAGDLQLIQA
jgi:hypothetical protein